jgi:hypothetical protein
LPFVPTVKILDEEKTNEQVADNEKAVVVSKHESPEKLILINEKKVLNPESTAFVPSKIVLT